VELSFRAGKKRSRKGVPKPTSFPIFQVITPSQIAKGYLYITSSRIALAQINTDSLDVSIANEKIFNRRIRLGRIMIPRRILRENFVPGTPVGIYMISEQELEIKKIEQSALDLRDV